MSSRATASILPLDATEVLLFLFRPNSVDPGQVSAAVKERAEYYLTKKAKAKPSQIIVNVSAEKTLEAKAFGNAA